MNKLHLLTISILCIVLSLTLFIQENMGTIYSAYADYCFKKKDLPKAELFYEKAFENGETSEVKREKYLNLILNSQFTLENQEKLVKFLDLGVNDKNTLRVKYYFHNLKNSINKQYPQNYISPAVYNQQILRWTTSPINYVYENSGHIPDYFTEKIDEAFSKWEIETNHKILFAKGEKPSNIIIRFKDMPPPNNEGEKFIIAYTAPDIKNSKLQCMNIDFYTRDVEGNYFSPNQIYNTALHEIVHALGFMGHSYRRNDVMYLSKNMESFYNDAKQEPTLGDINTVKLLYNILPDISNTSEKSGKYIPYVVLGEKEDINLAKHREAKNYIQKAPYLPNGYIDLAESYVAEKQYHKAVGYLEKALTLTSDEATKQIIFYDLALSYFYMDDIDTSKTYLEKAFLLKTSEDLEFLAAKISSKEGKNQEAILILEDLISKHPDYIDYTIALANIYVNSKEYFKARKVLKTFTKRYPNEKNNPRFSSYGILML